MTIALVGYQRYINLIEQYPHFECVISLIILAEAL